MRRKGLLGVVVCCAVLCWSGAAWAHCPEHGETCPPDVRWLESLGTLSDRMFLTFDWALGGMILGDQFEEVFDGGGLGVTMRMGGGVGNLALLTVLSVQSLETPVYEPLAMLTVGLEGRWYVPLHEDLDGLRLWGLASYGRTWLTHCGENDDCEGVGDEALSDYTGQMGGLGVGVGWFLEGGFAGFYAEARVERQLLKSELLERSIEGDLTVIMFGIINELNWSD